MGVTVESYFIQIHMVDDKEHILSNIITLLFRAALMCLCWEMIIDSMHLFTNIRQICHINLTILVLVKIQHWKLHIWLQLIVFKQHQTYQSVYVVHY